MHGPSHIEKALLVIAGVIGAAYITAPERTIGSGAWHLDTYNELRWLSGMFSLQLEFSDRVYSLSDAPQVERMFDDWCQGLRDSLPGDIEIPTRDYAHVDCWGNYYRSRVIRAVPKYEVGFYSLGEDGRSATAGDDTDDIASWRTRPEFYIRRSLWKQGVEHMMRLSELMLLAAFGTMWACPKKSVNADAIRWSLRDGILGVATFASYVAPWCVLGVESFVIIIPVTVLSAVTIRSPLVAIGAILAFWACLMAASIPTALSMTWHCGLLCLASHVSVFWCVWRTDWRVVAWTG